MRAPAGTIIDNQFEVLSVIGVGGFGVVYRARQINLDREVALKMISNGLGDDPAAAHRFEREAQTMGALKHRNLVTVYGSGISNGLPYISMEYLSGVSLQRVIDNEGSVDYRRTIDILLQLLSGLSCAHSNAIIHRDLKPSNVMLIQRGNEEVVKLIDFGLAKVVSGAGIEAQKVTEAGFAIGSVMYMSPEQCLAKNVDHRSDIYAAGCIMHRCLTGAHPYDGEHSAIVMMQHVQSSPRMLSESLREGSYPGELQWVLNKALAKNIEDRYQSADEMASDLLLISKDRSGEVSCQHAGIPQSTKSDAARPPRRNSLMIAAFVSSLLTVLVVVLMSGVKLGPAGPSSIELYQDADAAIRRNDRETAIPLYEKAIEQGNQDKLLEASRVAEGCTQLASYYAEHASEKGMDYGRLGTDVALKSNLVMSDRMMDLTACYLGAAIKQFRPSEALLKAEQMKPLLDPLLSGGAIQRLDFAIAEGYAMYDRAQECSDLLQYLRKAPLDEYQSAQLEKVEGEVSFDDSDWSVASKRFEHSLRLRSDDRTALADLIRTKIAMGDWTQAEAHYKTLVEFGPPILNEIGLQALFAAHAGEFQRAVRIMRDLEHSVEIYPEMYKTIHLNFDLTFLNFMATAAKNEKAMAWTAEGTNHYRGSFGRQLFVWKHARADQETAAKTNKRH